LLAVSKGQPVARIREAVAAGQRSFGESRLQEAAAKQAVAPRVDPRVQSYAQQWLEANPWYDPSARDEDSAVTKAIDDRMVRDGWDPASPEYWHELTRRVAGRINTASDNDGGSERTPRRKAPPTGNTREFAPTSTRNEVVVTPERKQAMMEAGAWDDPVARKRLLKAYQEYDRNPAR